MFAFSPSFMFDFELTRIAGSTSSGGCDIGEFKSAVGRIRKHDAESWYLAWKEEGERAEGIALSAAKSGFRILARNAYLRAANYYRAASYMFYNTEPRVVEYSEKSIKMFERATKLMDGEVLFVEIPYENGLKLPGWLFLPPKHARLPGKIPVIMYCGGADSTKEELYFLYGHTGPELGYAVLCFEGPGQGLLLKRNKIPLRPDFEVIGSSVLDFITDLSNSRPELDLDLDRIAVAGAATGGYFSLRAATDVRIKACLAIDPFYSLWDLALTRAPKSFVNMWDSGWVPDAAFDTFTDNFCRGNFQAGWEMMLGKSSMGVERATAMLRRFKDFSLEKDRSADALNKIICPVFITGPGQYAMYASADDSTFKIQKLLTKVPDSKKEVWVPADVAEGGLTAKIGAWALLAQKSFEFLDKHFEIERKAL